MNDADLYTINIIKSIDEMLNQWGIIYTKDCIIVAGDNNCKIITDCTHIIELHTKEILISKLTSIKLRDKVNYQKFIKLRRECINKSVFLFVLDEDRLILLDKENEPIDTDFETLYNMCNPFCVDLSI